jgi:DNA-binding ferritin-like protein (Dps family)
MKDLEKNHENYTEADWKSKDSKIEQFVNDCYPELKMSLTGEEKMNFWTKYVKYMIIRHGSGALKEIERADQASTVDIYDEIIESVDEVDLQNMLKEMYGEDIEEAVDEVLNQINNWGEKLKNWLKTKEN